MCNVSLTPSEDRLICFYTRNVSSKEKSSEKKSRSAASKTFENIMNGFADNFESSSGSSNDAFDNFWKNFKVNPTTTYGQKAEYFVENMLALPPA